MRVGDHAEATSDPRSLRPGSAGGRARGRASRHGDGVGGGGGGVGGTAAEYIRAGPSGGDISPPEVERRRDELGGGHQEGGGSVGVDPAAGE